MKILLITTRFPPYKGGVENVVENLAKNLAKNHTVSTVAALDLAMLLAEHVPDATGFNKIVAKFKYGFKVSEKDDNYGNCNVRRFWIQFPRSLFGVLSFPYRLVVSTLQLYRYTKLFDPDVINYHFPDDSAFYVWMLTSIVKVPLVLNIHGNDLHVFSNKFFYAFFIRRLVERADSIIVNSDYMREGFVTKYEKSSHKVQIISNGIDINHFEKIEPKPYFPTDYIFYVGRMVHKKGADILLRAFAKAAIEGLSLYVEGKGEEFENIKSLAKDLEISDKLEFGEGKLDMNTKNAYMKASLFGVLPSRIEPFGIVALEMMACGIPIIASETGGLVKIMKNNRNCLFFENESVSDLAEKIGELYEDQQLQKKMREKNLMDIQQYDNSVITDQYVKVYESLL